MRIGILAHSFSSAFPIFEAVEDSPRREVFIILSPSPYRSAWTSLLANLARLVLLSLKEFNSKPLQLLATGRLVLLPEPFHDKRSVDALMNLKLDVGLHKAGVIYRDATIQAFHLGILNHHIGILPAYRGRSVLEWSILRGDRAGVTVFFIDTGIDTGSRILISEQVDISSFQSVAKAKQYLFSLDTVFFGRAVSLLESEAAFQLNDDSGRRYFVMSKLFSSVVERLLRDKI